MLRNGTSWAGKADKADRADRADRAAILGMEPIRKLDSAVFMIRTQGTTMRVKLLFAAGVALVGTVAASTPIHPSALSAPSAQGPAMTVYKTPTCGCCANWVEHMKKAGFKVQ